MRRSNPKPYTTNPYHNLIPTYLYDVFYTFVTADGKQVTHVSAGYPMDFPEPQKAFDAWSERTTQFVRNNLITAWVKPRARTYTGYDYSPSWFSGGIVYRSSKECTK